jgi:hypothetical protein
MFAICSDIFLEDGDDDEEDMEEDEMFLDPLYPGMFGIPDESR